MSMFKPEVIDGGNPYMLEWLQDLAHKVEHGQIKAIAMVRIEEDDQICADYVKGSGVSMAELLGASEVLKSELLDHLREG